MLAPLVRLGCDTAVCVNPRTARADGCRAGHEKQGQASGINLTIQMFGGTIGMAICGSILAATGSYRLVFLITGLLVLATIQCDLVDDRARR